MKTTNYIFNLLSGAALLLSAFACSREELDVPSDKPVAKTEFRLGIADFKTSLGASESGSRKVYWSTGDQVRINGIESDALTEVGEAVSSAVFTFDEAPTAPYKVIYPAAIYKDATTVTLPAYQTWKQGTFDDGMFPMAGYSATGLDANMEYLCATIKVPILLATGENPDTDNIRVVSFEGRANERISGDFTIDYTASDLALTPVASPTDADKKVSVALNKTLSTSEAVDVFIVVPAMTYSHGFTITIQDSQGHTMTKTGYTQSGKELEAGKLYNMPDVRFVPSGTATGIEIWDAEDLIEFAAAYNNREYNALGSGLVATVMDDITFDANSSAAFNASGGIGCKDSKGDNYFEGTFNGNNKTISGLAGTVSMFRYTVSSGTIKDLTLDNSCSFTFTHPNSAELDAGAMVAYHRGTLKNVTVNADVALVAGNVSKVTALGGLVGRVVVGSVEDCTYAGNIIVPAGFSVTTQKTYIGGLVGWITNASGVIKDSYFNGTLETEARVSSTSTSDPYLYVGGIVGCNSGGTVEGCVTTDHPKSVLMANNTSYSGTLINHTTLAYFIAQGGIAGWNAGMCKDCTNGATVQNFVLTTGANGTASNDNSRYYNVGGIVGTNASAGTVTGCTNNAALESRSAPRIQKIGGVVGYNTGTVTSSSNTSAGSIYLTTSNISPYSLRVGEVGGIIGNNAGTVNDVSNAGNITLDRSENNAGVELKFGGVIGLTTSAIDGGSTKNISNSGNIQDTYNGTTVTTAGLRFGGVVGSAKASVKNVTNSGKVEFQLSSANVMSKLYMGGIVGEVNSSANVEVSGCENEGEVYFNVNGKDAAHTGNYIGGIVGFFTTSAAVNATISGCDNSGYIHSQCNNGTTAVTDIHLGGIAGKLDGSSDVSISSCNNNCSTGTEGKVHLLVGPNSDNNVGGILGYSATNVTISNSTNNGLSTYQLNAALENATINGCVGGIMGTLAAGKTASLTGCTNNGEVFFDNNGKGGTKDTDTGKYSGTYSGGILAKGAGVTFSGCTNNGYVHGGNPIKHNTTTCYTGGIVAYLSGSSSIIECTNTANVYNDQFVNSSNTTNAFTGGIAAFVIGDDGSPITISDCEHTTSSLGSRRGYQGGIVGYAKYVSISGSDNKSPSLGGSAYYAGGVAGWVQNGSITNCDFTGTEIFSSQLQANGGGGIAAKLDATTVDACQSSVTDIYHTSTSGVRDADIVGGAIVGISGSGNTVQNCHYKATINGATANIAGSGSVTDGGGNAADL